MLNDVRFWGVKRALLRRIKTDDEDENEEDEEDDDDENEEPAVIREPDDC